MGTTAPPFLGILAIISCGDGGKLLDCNAMGGQDRIEDEAPGVADFVAVRVGEFADQSVSSEQPQIAADGAGVFGLVFRRGGVEESLKVPIAQAMNRELASVDGLQQSVVLSSTAAKAQQ